MSYPDEWEEEVERMAADLHAMGEYPPSLEMIDRACAEHVARPALGRPLIAERIFAGPLEDDRSSGPLIFEP